MREHHCVDVGNRAGKCSVLCVSVTPVPLEQPAVEQHGPSAGTNDVTGARYLARRAGEFDFHGYG